MSNLSFDYSKWDKLDISDDEEDYHPNIDASLMIRIKREQRAKREAEFEAEKARLLKIGTPEALEDLKRLEKSQKLHVGNICHVVDEKTIVNKIDEKKDTSSSDSTSMKTPPTESTGESLENFFETHTSDLERFCNLSSLEDSEYFIRENHRYMLTEDACGWLLLTQLSLEMEGKRDEMIKTVRQYLQVRNIMDLAKEANRPNDMYPFIKVFYDQMKSKETDPTTGKTRLETLEIESVNFSKQIIARAIQKKKEMALESMEGAELEELTDEQIAEIEKNGGLSGGLEPDID